MYKNNVNYMRMPLYYPGEYNSILQSRAGCMIKGSIIRQQEGSSFTKQQIIPTKRFLYYSNTKETKMKKVLSHTIRIIPYCAIISSISFQGKAEAKYRYNGVI